MSHRKKAWILRHLPSVTRDLDTRWTPFNESQSERQERTGFFWPLQEAANRNEDQQYAMRTTSLHSRKGDEFNRLTNYNQDLQATKATSGLQ